MLRKYEKTMHNFKLNGYRLRLYTDYTSLLTIINKDTIKKLRNLGNDLLLAKTPLNGTVLL